MKKPVISIDGYSSTGKSSISKEIAHRLGLIHVDTGALYRGITLYGLEKCTQPDGTIDLSQLLQELPNIHLEFRLLANQLSLYLNNHNVDEEIRNPRVSEHVSFVAKQPEVRAYLLDMQRRLAQNGGIIMDGRDIGTIVLPDAGYKFFLTATVAERARRRHLELQNMGVPADLQAVTDNLISRDKTDSEREVAPLRIPDGAIVIDNTDLNKEETIQKILQQIS